MSVGSMVLVILIILHVLAIYVGAQVAQLEYADVWRCAIVAFLSYLVMVVVGLLLSPLLLVPILNIFFGAIVLGVGTAFAAKMVLSCDWQPAWTIGVTVAIINLLASWVFSGCS
jgi:hypothetical protein